MNLEQPVPDAVEQHTDAVPGDSDSGPGPAGERPLEADEADTAEQLRDLGPDDEEYR